MAVLRAPGAIWAGRGRDLPSGSGHKRKFSPSARTGAGIFWLASCQRGCRNHRGEMAARVPSAGFTQDFFFHITQFHRLARCAQLMCERAVEPINRRTPMKTHRRFTLGVLAGLGLALAISAPDALAQQKSPLVGTWHVTSAQLLMS